MLETLCSLLVLGAVTTWAVIDSRRRGETRARVLPFTAPALPGPARSALPFWLIGPALMIAGLLVIMWPDAPSDCHGSPVCGIGALGTAVGLFIGGALVIAGVLVVLFVAVARGGTNRPRGDTVSTRRDDERCQ